jgi:phosphoribosyl-ATP pyrophosphohydrolase
MYKTDKQLWRDLYLEDREEFNNKVKEECFEFGLAFTHWLDDKVEDCDLAEEMADMYIQLEKLMTVYGDKLEKDFLNALYRKQNMIKSWVYFDPNREGEQ